MSAKQFWGLMLLLPLAQWAWAGDRPTAHPPQPVHQLAAWEEELEELILSEQDAKAAAPAAGPVENTLLAYLSHWAHALLLWIGFGTLVGLTAKAIMPGRDPGGPVATLLMGIAGSLIGCGVLLLLGSDFRVSPISPMGFLAGTAGAFVLLLFYRILSNSSVIEAADRSWFKRTAKPST